MRTFNQIKESVLYNLNVNLRQANENLARATSDLEIESIKKYIAMYQSEIENIDKTTSIEIGYLTNSLISSIQKAYKQHQSLYWDNFPAFIEHKIVRTTPEGRIARGDYTWGECEALGVEFSELTCFNGRDPMSDEPGDLFRQNINSQFGVKIPTAEEERQALQSFKDVRYSDDELAKAQAFMHLRETESNAGRLKVGASHNILENDEAYQEAKAFCDSFNNAKHV